MRKKLTLGLYLALVEVLSYTLVVLPAYSFQVSSSYTGYVRVASQAAMSSMVAAQRTATLASVAPLISGASAGSVAVRLVAGSVGWPALGIVAGMTFAMLYYNQTQVAAIKAAAAPPGGITVPGYNGNAITAYSVCPGGTGCIAGVDQVIFTTGFGSCSQANPWGTLPAGWSNNGVVIASGCTSPGPWTWSAGHIPSVPSTKGTIGASTPATTAQVQTYLTGLPSTDPNSVESNTVAVGAQSTPTPSDSTAFNAVPSTGLSTSVVPASSVQPTDLVVNPNAVAPSGTVATQTTPSQSTTGTNTTTTTTTTNPNGSVTTSSTSTETEGAVSSCAAGNHEERTFGTILQTHMNTWQGTGLLSALNLLKNLSWPTAIPTYTLTSTLMGTYTLDFSPWAGMLTAIRSLIIAIASFVAYRIVFVGSK